MDLLSPNECVVTWTMSLVLRMSRIAGVAPLRFKNTREGWIVRVSPAAHTYGRILATAINLLALSVIIRETRGRLERSGQVGLDGIVWVVHLSSSVLVVSVAAFTGLHRMRCLIECMVELQKINLKLQVCREKRSCEIIRMIIPMGSMALAMVTICFQYATTTFELEVIALEMMVVICLFIIQMFVIQFAQLAMSVLISLQMLNKYLKNLLQEIVDSNSPEASQSIATRVRLVSSLYCSIGDVVCDVNHSYGGLLFTMLLRLLLALVITPYNAIMSLVNKSLESPYLQISWGVYHLISMLMIIEPCHQTHAQMTLTKQLISQMTRYSPPEHHALMFELELFYRQVMLNNVTYSPLAMFTLNRALIVTVVSSITTYLVIIVQS